ncbi:MAG: glycerol-3-phosphate 1-O-acyltransferase, partial [Gammaproteobacteria bacterium]
PPVRNAIREAARKEKIPEAKAEARALKYADEIASNLSIATIRFLEILLTWVWNKIYNGVRVHGLDRVKEEAGKGAVVYVPCHRSHIDYLLLSYVLYKNGLSVPHIAAGINLNMPIVGGILRRGGAFFMRRSFRNNKLYAAVFNEYMHSIFTRGYPMEYFVEGGRSRTGRTLPPRAGMLLMTVRSFLRDHNKPIIFVPVYIGYEKVMEARTYLGELKGKKKEKENVFGLIRSVRNLRNTFGQVSLNFGEPFRLGDLLDRVHPQWREEPFDPESRPAWLPGAVESLADEIAVRINNATALNPVNMIATALHATPRQAMDERLLKEQLETQINLLRALPYSPDMSFPDTEPATWVDYCADMGVVHRQSQKLGDIILMDDLNAILTTYYRNNVLHTLALPAMIACLFENNAAVSRERAVWLVSATYPYVRSELFMRWPDEEVDPVIESWIDVLVDQGLLIAEGDQLYRPATGSRESVRLSYLAQVIIPTLERYYIAIAILRKHGSGTLTASRLEELSTLMAERMSILYGLNAPEFFDKMLFRNFIAKLRKKELLSVNEDGQLAYSERIEEVMDAARFVLDPAVRQSILTITTQAETD